SLRPVGTRTQAASPLLPVAARCAALALTQATLLRALERTALTDEYTGLGNRQAFLADLHAEVAFAARHGARFAVTLVDLGNIRYLNATSGYAGGNDLISRLARTLRTATRTEDRAYRLNGATFALLLRLPQEPGEAVRGGAVRGWQDRLGAALTQLKQAAPVPLDLQTSLVVCPEDAASTSELLRQALEKLGPVQPPAPPLPGTADHRLSSPQDRRRPHDG
ncbi:GGDEF domain-containing protein, partial [Deinococcus sp. 6YEL10]|uniref:GGDEF domain-containing protein n=1 Tax=Deinococcus sp. 6YEL10 TaxID=2745870 RepID=UPI001E28FC6F